jgi:regulator of extracellular matrix RemA (YlzA/DUF370 family)
LTIHIGSENYINADEVFAVAKNKGATMKKVRLIATRDGKYYSLSGGDPTRSLIIMNNGVIFGSCVTAKTLSNRINSMFQIDAITDKVLEDADIIEDAADDDEFRLDDTYAAETEDDDEEDD